MRILLLLAIAALSFNCSKKDKSITISKKESVQNLPINREHKTEVSNKNVQYLGYINKFYFSNKNEAYIEVYFTKDEINPEEYNKLVKLADSLVYKDDENSRYRFPANLAAKYFDLRGLSKLSIYDNTNKYICNANFVRIEYLDQPISPCFIAVYKTDKKIKSESYYAISNAQKKPETANYSLSRDTVLTQKILNKLKVSKSYSGLESSGTHILFKQNDTILSVINSDNSVYIVSHSGETYKILYQSSEPENIYDLKVIPIMKNKLPYLLTTNSQPETDMSWNTLLYFDGTKYVNSKRQRIE